MVQSMTGYGKASARIQSGTLQVEIRSLNSKTLDLYARIPQNFREKEIEIRQLISDSLERGKVDVSLTIEKTEAQLAGAINMQLAKSYFSSFLALEKETGRNSPDLLAQVLRMPDVFSVEKTEVSEEEWETTLNTVQEAIEHVVLFRQKRGAGSCA